MEETTTFVFDPFANRTQAPRAIALVGSTVVATRSTPSHADILLFLAQTLSWSSLVGRALALLCAASSFWRSLVGPSASRL